MSVDEGCSSFSVLGQFVCVYLMMCDGIFILTGDNKVLECKWDSVVFMLRSRSKETNAIVVVTRNTPLVSDWVYRCLM